MPVTLDRREVLALRIDRQQLERGASARRDALTATAILDLGVQDSGQDGGRWALTIRGATAEPGDDLALLWTLRGAPHFYRRADLPSVAAATAPFSDADAYKRIFDASKPLRDNGIAGIEALDSIGAAMREIVTRPMVKGEVSTRLTTVLDPAYLRHCNPCNATHAYEQTFRLGATRAGLELQPDTRPPVLRRVPGRWRRAAHPKPQHDVVRAALTLIGPSTPALVATFLDARPADVKARWPEDATEVVVDGETRWLLGPLGAPTPNATRLLGSHDLLLQARDREVLVDDRDRAKRTWPTIGRPGVVLHRGAVAGLWRPRTRSGRLTVLTEVWGRSTNALSAAIGEQAEQLAAFRGVPLAGVEPA